MQDDFGESEKFGGVEIGGGPEGHAIGGPVEEVIAAGGGEGLGWGIGIGGGEEEEVDEVFVATVDEGGDGLVVEDVDARPRRGGGSRRRRSRGRGGRRGVYR